MTPKYRRARDVILDHQTLCFKRAFPTSQSEYRQASSQLRQIEKQIDALPVRERKKLWDTGIAGTTVHYGFSFPVAQWLAKHAHGHVSIDWDEVPDTSRLDELLVQLIHAAEDEYFDSGRLDSRDWIDAARSSEPGTDFDWLMAQLQDQRWQRIWNQLYDAADLHLVWALGNASYSKSRNVYPTKQIHLRDQGFRPRPNHPKREIMQPLEPISLLRPREGQRMIDVAMASLAVRHRETYHFNYANPKEVYLADVGKGISVAIFGLLAEHRFPLETTLGYLLLSNGAPIGYGGSSVVFKQANTGVNIFDEYRNSEAAYLWIQVMRVYHNLIGCTRFIAEAYQFGEDNPDALKSGAFWFYYRLGYRPVFADVRKLAQQEAKRIRKDRGYRSDLQTLKQLASCDMHLCLPGARSAELFEQRWLETSSGMAMQKLGITAGKTHQTAAANLSKLLAGSLGIQSMQSWSRNEREGFSKLAPLVAITEPHTWSHEDKVALHELMRAKGGALELTYAKLLAQNDVFLQAIRTCCRRAESSATE